MSGSQQTGPSQVGWSGTTIVITMVGDGKLQVLGQDLLVLGQPLIVRGQTWAPPSAS